MAKAAPMFTISTAGSVVTASGAAGAVQIDASKLPDAQKHAALVQGVASMLRVAYANAENAADGFKMLQNRASGLLEGKWLPGSRSGEPKEPDDLARAVMEAVKITHEHYENVFLPNWLNGAKHSNGDKIVSYKKATDGRTRMVGKADAMRALSEHPNVAPILARIAAERAKEHAKDRSAPSLSSFTNATESTARAAE